MHTIFRRAPACAVGVVLAASTACAAAQTSPGSTIDMSTCRDVTTQVEIDGAVQPVNGRACLQSDGNWVLVGTYDDWAGYPYAYDYYPWYWGAPVLIGGSFVFVDRFHHFHHFHHEGGFHSAGGMRPAGMSHGWRGGWGGGMGGGMHRR